VPILSRERKQHAARGAAISSECERTAGGASDPNKFAALSSEVQPTRNLQHLCRRIDGFGFHEVIIDSPDHARCMALPSDEHVASILRVYRERYNTLSIDRRVNHITISRITGRT
jgi:UDPglucose--hexose-1-phosphate uridylyltransferase